MLTFVLRMSLLSFVVFAIAAELILVPGPLPNSFPSLPIFAGSKGVYLLDLSPVAELLEEFLLTP